MTIDLKLNAFAQKRQTFANLERRYGVDKPASRYDEGVMLFSGPKASRDGEVLVIRAESDEWIKEFIKDEPYHKLGVAEYTFTCFMPTMKNSMVDGWV